MLISLTFLLNAAINFALGLAVAKILGPAEFGRFAIGATLALTLNSIVFEWLRLSATRLYGAVARESEPDLRASLNAAYLGGALVLMLIGAVLLLLSGKLHLSPALSAATIVTAIANGFFEYWAALARARFRNVAYAKLVIVKNIAGLVFMIAAGVFLHDAAAVLAASSLAALVSLAPVRRELRDPGTALSLARKDRILSFGHYGVPLVIANVIYQLILLANRSLAAAWLGFAAAGQLALATDLSQRLLQTVAAGFDVFLFQLVVGREATHGKAAAQKQVAINMLLVVAVVLPLAAGYVAIMPSFEAILIPAKYRSSFAPLSLILVPGLVLYCLAQFAFGPVFQLAMKTRQVIWAALAALACYVALLAVLARGGGLEAFAWIHCASYAVGATAIAIMGARLGESWPRLRDLLAVLAATAAMLLAIWPLRSIGPSWLALVSAVTIGPIVYCGLAWALDIAGIRQAVLARYPKTQRLFANGK
ncbi:MAG: lipopolysaccharide biosynthesis protein [Methylovirgula sp.]|nr:lipopolysaccharide biosynthesis protein [Methylovirgula sp.]